MSSGKSIRLFLVDGTPTGLLTAEIPNWTGHILVAPRTRIQEALVRPEASKTGVYFLTGEEAGRPIVYVGEGDCIADRIKKHAKDPDKEFWERVCLVTSKDVNLTKAHVRYLESRLVQLIAEGGRADIVNGNEPPAGSLPEADLSDMEFFLGQMQILLPTVGMDFLRPKSIDPGKAILSPTLNLGNDQAALKEPPLLLLKHKSGADGRAYEVDGEVVVLKGSIGTGEEMTTNQYAPLRQQLLDSGKLRRLPDGRVELTEDVTFKSPSAAAAVLNNRNSAGPREWRLEATGQTLGDWRNSLLEQLPIPQPSE